MPYLVTLVVLLTVLGLVNLTLTVGVIRRLREHTDKLAAQADAAAGRKAVLAEGESAAPFRTLSTDGSDVSRDLITEPTLIGAFSPGCEACHEALPDFVAMARRFPGGPSGSSRWSSTRRASRGRSASNWSRWPGWWSRSWAAH
ncbi:hypothetical protein [Peterkaempfera sp. SMS 1(5)a]|uniref:hypothetical protein n=1 Tax=Peterkaempfera podocarpi TaxID=3232308 RepID=UPI00366A5EB8